MRLVPATRTLGTQRGDALPEELLHFFLRDRLIAVGVCLPKSLPHEVGKLVLGQLAVFVRVRSGEESVEPSVGIGPRHPGKSTTAEATMMSPCPMSSPMKRESMPAASAMTAKAVVLETVTAETVMCESAVPRTVMPETRTAPVHSVTRKASTLRASMMPAAAMMMVTMMRTTGCGPTEASPVPRPTAAVMPVMSSPMLSSPVVVRPMMFVTRELKVIPTAKPAPAKEVRPRAKMRTKARSAHAAGAAVPTRAEGAAEFLSLVWTWSPRRSPTTTFRAFGPASLRSARTVLPGRFVIRFAIVAQVVVFAPARSSLVARRTFLDSIAPIASVASRTSDVVPILVLVFVSTHILVFAALVVLPVAPAAWPFATRHVGVLHPVATSRTAVTL